MLTKNKKFIYDCKKDEVLGIEVIRNFINKHEAIVNSRYKKLENYFEGKQAILNRQIDNDKPNNRNVFNYCRYVSDQLTGYFLGKPISYSGNEVGLENLKKYYRENNEELENNILAHKASVKGTSYEICYLDEQGEFKFKALDTDSVFFILDSTINNNIIAAVRYFYLESLTESEENKLRVFVYYPSKTLEYKEGKEGLELLEEKANDFGEIPIIEFSNNRYRNSDFESILDIQDAINKLKNDIANDLDYYSNCLLALEGVDGTDKNTTDDLENGNKRTLLLPEGAKAYFITKQINNTVVENYSEQLRGDLHLLANIPDLNKINISSDMKATAVKSLFFSTEQVVAEKERMFKIALEKRLRLFCKFLNIKKNLNLDWKDIDITFNRNIPVNLAEFGDSVIKLQGTLPREMVLEELKKAGLDINVERALKLLKEENNAYILDNSIPNLEGILNE